MSDFYSREPLPLWRIIFYGCLAAAGVAAVGYFQHDHSLYFGAVILGAVIGGFGYVLSWTRANVRPVQVRPGQKPRFPAWVYWLFYGGLAVSTALKLWDLTHKAY